jgi:hypothetical protein
MARRLVWLCLSVAAGLSLACEELPSRRAPITGPSPTSVVFPLEIYPGSTTLEVGRSVRFTASVERTLVFPVWSSSNSGIARVDGDGLATCVTPGNAVITATLTGSAQAPANAPAHCIAADAFTVTPLLSFDHTIGRSPCPQLAGVIRIRKTAGSLFSNVVRVASQHPALDVRVTDGSVGLDHELQVEVYFNCDVQQGFAGQIKVTVGTGENAIDFFTAVSASVHR